ncbi:MAG: DMT family transporter [Paracoccaceae bacterium]|nr:DMT family transporter [Paracoccaceae bacterium]
MQNQSARLAVLFAVLSWLFISMNNVVIKILSETYPLHQMVFFRSAIGIFFGLFLVKLEGGWQILKTDKPFLHSLRGLLVVVSNMFYFSALAILPLADTAAIFFTAPLLITLLSVPFLGEAVGLRRIGAVIFGFIGMLIIMRPFNLQQGNIYLITYCFPLLAALCYALMQILTRKLGGVSKASAMAVYIQMAFLFVSTFFWILFGDGRYVDSFENPSMVFLLRAWVWPIGNDWPFFLFIGILSAGVGYGTAQAYRLATASFIAPFEYVALPLAAIWGWFVFGDLPDGWASIGMLIIVGSGLYMYQREKTLKQQ